MQLVTELAAFIPQLELGGKQARTGRTSALEAEEPTRSVLQACSSVAYACVERQGLVWVWGEPLRPGSSPAPDEATIPTCEALDDERFVWIDVSRDMPYSADMLLENVLDTSHVPFTHHRTISRRDRAARERG